ncbi:muts domain V-domain-containing protein [Bombardia bombarda]|uniref:DNA mismatch repair protein MSH5 n=1 Tax=Bombardia bombarda TaxID=252184 RepID=A0AA39X6L6_9PEZI|nr:muts domain V-domain-containing protein [Bombardia bombarda]
MALDMDKDGRVGCAFYIVADETLFIEEDTAMGGIEAVETVVFRVQPTTILIPNRAPSTLVELLEKDAQRIDEDRSNSALQGSHILRHLSAAHFDYDASKEALVRIDSESSVPDPVEVLPAQEDAAAHCFNSSNHSKLMHLAESVNLDSHTSIGCAGAVLGDLARRRTAECLAPDADAPISFQVRSIKMNTPKSSLIVSADALISLQIMRSEHHPNPQVQNASTLEPNAKERLSICALLQALAGTAEGKANIRQMLFRPTTDLGLIRERQRTIAVLLRPENNEAVEAIRKQLQKIKNVRAPLLRVKKGTDRLRGQLSIRLGDWRALLRFTMVSTRLKEAIMSLEGGVEVTIFSKIYHNIDSQCILTIGEMIMNTIDFKLSKDVGHTEIFPGASERLDELKQEFGEVYHMLPNIKEGIEREGVYDGRDIEGDDWEVIFVKDDMVYYKTHVMRILDEQYGDLPSRIIEEEIHIIMELSAVVMEYEAVLVKASVLLGELDSLLALALAAEKHQWTAPQMTDKNIMDIKDGRHPLQELVVSSFIPNDCNLTGGPGARGSGQSRVSMNDNETQPCMLILTGPNNSGKSIYMKQVAIIVHLAHIGSYVPATSATIGVTDRILTRIATRESGVDDESAFLIDLKQMAFSMNFATRRSLILIDEFGKGTTAETGAALLAAVLVNFLHFGVNRPKILVGTHFHELFTTGLIKAESGVALAHMDFRMNADAQDPQDYITFLFRLVSGRGTSSLGTMCAAINGVEREVVERAADLVLMQSRNEDLEEAFRDDTDEDVEELRKAELIARRFLAVDVSELGEAKDIRELLRNIFHLNRTATPTAEVRVTQ